MDEVVALSEQGFHLSGDFPANHSTRFVLVDPQGRIRGYYKHLDSVDMQRLRQDIKALAGSFR
jgi:cytochrome oxidase Cu insertion factor (SCO1/SenC/PrrC family)